MRFRQICPHWEALPTDRLLWQAGPDILGALMGQFSDWYRVNLPLWLVLQHVGYTGEHDRREGPRYPLVDSTTRVAQLSCLLPSHGGVDAKPSTRYFIEDRNEGTAYGHLFCFGPNCKKPYTSFWYLYTMLKAQHDAEKAGHPLRYLDAILYIESRFGVPFPRHLLLDADPDNLDENDVRFRMDANFRQRCAQAALLRETVRPADPATYLQLLAALYLQPLSSDLPV